MKRKDQPKPDYNLIARLEVELGIVDPPVVVEGVMSRKQFDSTVNNTTRIVIHDTTRPKLAGLGGEEWFKICRGDTDAGLD